MSRELNIDFSNLAQLSLCLFLSSFIFNATSMLACAQCTFLQC